LSLGRATNEEVHPLLKRPVVVVFAVAIVVPAVVVVIVVVVTIVIVIVVVVVIIVVVTTVCSIPSVPAVVVLVAVELTAFRIFYFGSINGDFASAKTSCGCSGNKTKQQ
jgi:hypothetical protein